jgi:squalene-hopene/tetraprenyl-beta-curcumene cyclase
MRSTTPANPSAATALFDEAFRARIEQAKATAVTALLHERNSAGHWTGELSASALSTATAVTALTLVARAESEAAPRLSDPIARGFRWLIEHQNADGGWGDTTRSISNISTTTLVWAALNLAPESTPGVEYSARSAERWLARATGSIEPTTLVAAIERRYGDDKTFSIPILTMCALCGRLAKGGDTCGSCRSSWPRCRRRGSAPCGCPS